MKTKLIIFAVLVMALFGCEAGTTGQEVAITSPYIGGTQGLDISFQDMRTEMFDQGDSIEPVIKIENRGEHTIPGGRTAIQLAGINPAQFYADANADNLKTVVGTELIATRKTPEGQVFAAPPILQPLSVMKYTATVPAPLDFPLRADICYDYQTNAVSKMCIRKDLLTPRAGGICEVTGSKPVFSSGAPIQVQNVQQNVRSANQIGISFDIVNVGGGNVYAKNSDCSRGRDYEDIVTADVDVGLTGAGVKCIGIGDSQGHSGEVRLFDNRKTIMCTVTVGGGQATDFEQLFTVKLDYEYEQSIATTLTVKKAGSLYDDDKSTGKVQGEKTGYTGY